MRHNVRLWANLDGGRSTGARAYYVKDGTLRFGVVKARTVKKVRTG
jgi:hypothetical protein